MRPEPEGAPSGEATEDRRLRFGLYEMDLASGELWKAGRKVKLQKQPFKVLALLATHPRELLTREEIQKRAWDDGTYVDFEQALNFCIRQIRVTLGDQANTPRYVETLPRRGYRFIAPVEVVPGNGRPERAELPRIRPSTPDDAPDRPRLTLVRPAVARQRRTVQVTLAVLALALAATLGRLTVSPQAGQTDATFQRVTFRRGTVYSARFGPDGQIVYSAAWEGNAPVVYATSAARSGSRPLELATPGYVRLVGTSERGDLAFLSGAYGSRTLSRTRLVGGPVKRVLENVIAADWSRDGRHFAVARRVEKRLQVEFPVGTVLGHASHISHLRLAPDGMRVAFLEHPSRDDDRGSVVVLDREGGRKVVSPDWASLSGLAWSPDGREVWFTGTRVGADAALYAATLKGELRTLFPALGRLTIHDVAVDGRVLLTKDTARLEVRYGRQGLAHERDLSWLDLSAPVQLSRDGRHLLFFESGEGGGPGYSVFLRDVNQPLPVRLGTGRARSLSPDGRWVLTTPVAGANHMTVLPTGAGEDRVIRDPGFAAYGWARWLPDGKSFVFNARENSRGWRVYVRGLESGPARALTPEGVRADFDALSPDGTHLVAKCDGGFCLYALDGSAPRVLPGPGPEFSPIAWASPDTLYVRELRAQHARVHRMDLASGELRLWREFEPADKSGLVRVIPVLISGDGAAYVYGVHHVLSELYLVEGLS